MDRFNAHFDRFEKVILVTLTLLVATVVFVATVSVARLIVERVIGPGHLIEHVEQLPEVFGAFLRGSADSNSWRRSACGGGATGHG